MTTPAEFQELLDQPEGTNVEFKSAAGGFHFEELVKYCVALANAVEGTIVLGVTDQRPSEVVGTRAALGRHLGQAELIFEYRANEIPGPAADRREFRGGFLPVLDEIWQAVALRNDLQHFQQGLFVW